MATQQAQRRPSMLFEHYDAPVDIPRQLKQKEPTLKEEATKKLNAAKLLSIDDMDMISLKTNFDKQMILGSPMYLESDEETETRDENCDDPYISHFNHYTTSQNTLMDNCCLNPIPTDSTHFYCKNVMNFSNPFSELSQLRSNYISSSFQDNKSNIKYNIDNWLLYPKPLPKFWKFEKDERFKNEESEYDLSNPSKKIRNGYYMPQPFDEEYEKQRKQNVPYTGEYFDIEHYRNKNVAFRDDHGLNQSCQETRTIPTFDSFKNNFEFVIEMIQNHTLNSMSEKRLRYLLNKFQLFQHLKSKSEILENKQVPYRDFYNSRKVDQDLLLSGILSQRQLGEFIWDKINYEPDKIVYCTSEGEKLKVRDFFLFGKDACESLDIGLKLIDDEFLDWYRDIYLVTYHIIKVHDKQIESNLVGKELRYYLIAKTFLEFDNYIEGQYLAEILIKYAIHLLEKSKYQLVQISIDYQFMGKNGDDNFAENNWWIKFSKWMIKWKLISYNVRWNVQITRVFSKLFKFNMVQNFQDYLDLFFEPLFLCRDDPDLQYCLTTVCCFDVVISQSDEYLWTEFPNIDLKPKDWIANGDNPTISHYLYYLYAKLSELNQLRFNSNTNTIVLRSYCSPSASARSSQFSASDHYFTERTESLICNLLLCNGGLLQGESLWTAPSALEYLFYLFQIPILTAPLSSVSLHPTLVQNPTSGNFYMSTESIKGNKDIKHSRDVTVEEQVSYRNNPFMNLVKIGFRVAISSKSVLYNSSYTLEPIIEEYSVAASIYLLNAADLCELARNSVICSGFEGFYKAHWTGVVVKKPEGSPMSETIGLHDVWFDKNEDTRIKHNVPNIRREYRMETLNQEWSFIDEHFN
ncbi:hypothetical protein C6P44_000963 [Monosporozyma unispora]|nr:hypothetical protein C6P44_000963 [Kazachstania unispora]